MIRFTDNDISYIRMMYRQSKDPRKQIGILADMYICTKGDIGKALGLPIAERKNIRWSPQMDERMLRLKSEGKTNHEIAVLMGTTRESVRQRANRLRAKAEKAACNTGSCKR